MRTFLIPHRSLSFFNVNLHTHTHTRARRKMTMRLKGGPDPTITGNPNSCVKFAVIGREFTEFQTFRSPSDGCLAFDLNMGVQHVMLGWYFRPFTNPVRPMFSACTGLSYMLTSNDQTTPMITPADFGAKFLGTIASVNHGPQNFNLPDESNMPMFSSSIFYTGPTYTDSKVSERSMGVTTFNHNIEFYDALVAVFTNTTRDILSNNRLTDFSKEKFIYSSQPVTMIINVGVNTPRQTSAFQLIFQTPKSVDLTIGSDNRLLLCHELPMGPPLQEYALWQTIAYPQNPDGNRLIVLQPVGIESALQSTDLYEKNERDDVDLNIRIPRGKGYRVIFHLVHTPASVTNPLDMKEVSVDINTVENSFDKVKIGDARFDIVEKIMNKNTSTAADSISPMMKVTNSNTLEIDSPKTLEQFFSQLFKFETPKKFHDLMYEALIDEHVKKTNRLLDENEKMKIRANVIQNIILLTDTFAPEYDTLRFCEPYSLLPTCLNVDNITVKSDYFKRKN